MRLLNILFGALILGALGWTGWWYALATGQEVALAAWFDDRARAGWQAEHGEIGLTGFPLDLQREISDIRLADPKTGWAWTAPALQIDSRTYAPHRFTVTWPGEQTLAVPGERTEIVSKAMTAQMAIRPGLSMSLIDASASVAGLDVRGHPVSGPGWTARAGNIAAEVSERVNDGGYDIVLRAEAVLLPEPLLAQIDPTGLAGREVERVTFDGSAIFDAPLDRHLIEDGRLALRAATIRRAGFQWGRLRLEAKGDIKVDRQGYPVGKIALTARHWRQIVTMARRGGMIGPKVAKGIVTALEIVALLGGNKNELDATLTFEDGEVWIGPVPLGPAPRLAPPRG